MNMSSVGVVAPFEVADGNDDAVARFFDDGRAIVDVTPPATTVLFAYRLGPTTYGAFASFANYVDRPALLSAGGPQSTRDNAELFVTPRTFEQVDILAARKARAPQPDA